MAYEQKPNTGSLFKSDKAGSDTSPSHTGSINIDGVNYWLNAWVNEIKSGAKKGTKYFSLKVKPKEVKVDSHNQAKANGYAPVDDQDVIPF
jgi:hypothetical protein